MRISDWSSDVCSSDLERPAGNGRGCCDVHRDPASVRRSGLSDMFGIAGFWKYRPIWTPDPAESSGEWLETTLGHGHPARSSDIFVRSEEHTSELQSLMRSSYAVFCLKKKKTQIIIT